MSLTHNKKIIRDFSRAALTYDTHAVLQRKVADRLFQMSCFRHQVPGNERVILDIGCGTGYFHELLRKNKIYLPLVQSDISHAMCKVAGSYASPPEYGRTYTCTADMHSLPFADKSFTNIFSSMTLQWSDNLPNFFLGAKRVLKDAGRFDFSIVADGSLYELREVFLAAGEEPRVHKFIIKPELEDILRDSGFNIDEIFSETITIFFKDFREILHSIKEIGASYKGKNAGLKGKSYLVRLEKEYEKFREKEGLPLSWNIIYARLKNA